MSLFSDVVATCTVCEVVCAAAVGAGAIVGTGVGAIVGTGVGAIVGAIVAAGVGAIVGTGVKDTVVCCGGGSVAFGVVISCVVAI